MWTFPLLILGLVVLYSAVLPLGLGSTSAGHHGVPLGIPSSTTGANDPTAGNTAAGTSAWGANYIVFDKFTMPTAGSITQILVYSLGAGNVKVSIYDDSAGSPNNRLITEMAQSVLSGQWNTFTLTTPLALASGNYWFASNTDVGNARSYSSSSGGTELYASRAYSSAFPVPAGTGYSSFTVMMSIYAVYNLPGRDFSVSVAPPTSQNIGAGGTATFTLNLAATGGFSGTVNLSVASGCPPGVTCGVSPSSVSSYPNTATLSVPTLITTSGTFNVVISATNGTVTHTATATVIVGSASTYNFNARAGATQVVVTVSWTGTGAASVTIAGPGGTPSLSELGAVVYDRTTYQTGSSTPTNIHRVTFTLSSPPAGTWTAYVSQPGATVIIEVS
jgi:hypothetical protein